MNPRLLLAACPIVLAACGGGGSVPGSPPPTTFNVAAGLTNLLTTTANWTVSGVGSDGNNYAATIDMAPGLPAAYPLSATGTIGRTSVQSLSLSVNGTVAATSTTTAYFPDNIALPIGFRHDDGTCSTVIQSSAPPSNATVGASGALLTMNDLVGCAGSPATTGSTETSWSVEADGAVAYLCLKSKVRVTGSADVDTDEQCLEIDATGRLGTRAKIRVNVQGLSLEMKR